jgi:hypothetical protein
MSKESAYTSTRQVPALFKQNVLSGTNFDFGGGKYDDGTNYLKTQGVTNIVYDPFCRTEAHNSRALNYIEQEGIDSITCLNVLNVLTDDDDRSKVINTILTLVNTNQYRHYKYPTVFFQVYEGDKTGVRHPTNSQLNRRTIEFIPEIKTVFGSGWNITKKKNVITLTPLTNSF